MNAELPVTQLADLAGRLELGLVALFGSHARGQARPDSDLDLGVGRQDGRRLTARELGALRLELSRWSGREADVVDLLAADALLRFEVARDGRALWEAEPGAWSAFVARTLIDHDDLAPFLSSFVAAVGRAARGGAPR